MDEDPDARRLLRSALEARIARPMMIMETAEPDAARAMMAERAFDAVAVDLDTVGGPAGFSALIDRTPMVVAYALGAADRVQDAVACVRSGAADFIGKPLDGPAFARRIERQFVEVKLAVHNEFEGLIGRSPSMQALFDQIQRIAPSEGAVLILGSAGCGKSLIAKAVHARSRRRAAPFVTLDCKDGTPSDLVAELTRPNGALDRADGGTLFLEDVGFLPEAAQNALTRFFDTSEIADVDRSRRLSVRIIASSSHALTDLRGPKGLKSDLFFRLNVLMINAPSLDDRADDLPLLVEGLLRQAAREAGSRLTRISGSATQLLTGHDWPGDVGELKAFIESLARRFDGDLITAEMVAPLLSDMRAIHAPAVHSDSRRPSPADIRPLWMEEARLIEEAIAAFDGNIAKAAAALEISPSTIYRKRQNQGDGAASAVA
ncbi:sigma-54-dependent transcriptional regulator [Oryzibacter oryziterrae]|uniref:sigma-54-dependent transcriptional regulator n=1 Tax=Oryzibacter oryziterrae TaxID=2766474 RepID=UPI001F01FAB0|nr:sigma 54-interacting transcriptional regulator [Oryzibacter oryziterrae]